MRGFFDIPKQSSQKGATCAACGLYKYVLSPRMEAFGNFKKGILNVGEAPGETEDRLGRQWQGKVGQRLQRAFKSLGFDLFDDCLNVNSINCRPTDKSGNNRTPTAHEVMCCRPKVFPLIQEHRPKVIILFGNSALESVIGDRWQNDLDTIGRWRGWTIPDREFKAWTCPTFHPSYVERGDKEVETVWLQDLTRALDKLNEPFPTFIDESSQVKIVSDLSFLPMLQGPVAFDYETTGLKPHDKKHQIICMSVCNKDDHAWAFMLPTDPVQLRYIKKFLRSNVPKIAQNMKFEHTWSQNVLGVEVKNWLWDTMLASHVLDNRPKITGLKFQAYVQFGVIDYSSDILPFLRSKDSKNANSVNQIEDLIKTRSGMNKLLTYCGMDSIFEFRLAMKQMEKLRVPDTYGIRSVQITT